MDHEEALRGLFWYAKKSKKSIYKVANQPIMGYRVKANGAFREPRGDIMRGSFHNRMIEGNQYGELEVGMGATELLYTDRHAYTVQKVVSKNRVVVTRDEVERIDGNGVSDAQEYSFTPTPLWEGKREKQCVNWAVKMFTADGKTIDEVCKTRMECGSCEGCPFFRLHKPTNGITLIKTKHGWKQMGGDSRFALGVREEHYDYSF